MKTITLILNGLLLPFVATAQFSVDSVQYLWPTDASPYLSGTFAETRARHFHSALDIKTWGRKGYRVVATRDGTLHRIVIGPDGYGKAVYLKHADGSYSVYAHLLAFEDGIRQLADSIRFRNYSYEIDRKLDSLNIRIRQGEMIGYSGATGVGPAHLHFELRTPSEEPFNPLLTNLSVADNIPPRFSALSIEPLSPHTLIEGRNELYAKRALAEKRFYDFGTVDVSGPVGLGVDLFDQANRVSNAYAVYQLKLFLGNELLFHSRVDSFSYDETGQMFLDRVYPILRRGGSGYQRLYLADGNTLSFYRHVKNRGRLDLPPGSHRLRMVAEDYNGNTSEARLILNVDPRQQKRDEHAGREIEGTNGSKGTNGTNGRLPSRRTWDWHADWINLNGADSGAYTVFSIDTAYQVTFPRRISARSFLHLNTFDMLDIRKSNGDRIQLYRILPEAGGKVYGSDIQAYAKFPPSALYDTLSVGLYGRTIKPDSVKLTLLPANQPVRKDIELTYILDENRPADTTLALYSYNHLKNKFSYLPTRRGGRVLKATAQRLGTFFVMSDKTAPELYAPRIYKRADGRWVASVRCRDDRSGIDYKKSEFYVNGIRGIAEYEPEDDRLLYYHPNFQPSSVNRLKVEVTDMVDNKNEAEFQLN